MSGSRHPVGFSGSCASGAIACLPVCPVRTVWSRCTEGVSRTLSLHLTAPTQFRLRRNGSGLRWKDRLRHLPSSGMAGGESRWTFPRMAWVAYHPWLELSLIQQAWWRLPAAGPERSPSISHRWRSHPHRTAATGTYKPDVGFHLETGRGIEALLAPTHQRHGLSERGRTDEQHRIGNPPAWGDL